MPLASPVTSPLCAEINRAANDVLRPCDEIRIVADLRPSQLATREPWPPDDRSSEHTEGKQPAMHHAAHALLQPR
jgi:hypothetical protein